MTFFVLETANIHIDARFISHFDTFTTATHLLFYSQPFFISVAVPYTYITHIKISNSIYSDSPKLALIVSDGCYKGISVTKSPLAAM